MWNWFKTTFKYGKQILTAIKDILPVLELLLGWLEKQDFTDETVDDWIRLTKEKLSVLRDLLGKVGYVK